MASEDADEAGERSAKRLEVLTGLTVAIFAAVLAVVDLGGGKYGDDEIIGNGQKASDYAWYQSKSIKQQIAEQQRDLLQALLDAGSIEPSGIDPIKAQIDSAAKHIERYDREKKELLEGSAAVGPEGQSLEVDGEKGHIVGTKVWESILSKLGSAGDQFDLGTLWLQLSLVMGAMSLVVGNPALKKAFLAALVLGGVAGTWYGVIAFQIAMSAG